MKILSIPNKANKAKKEPTPFANFNLSVSEHIFIFRSKVILIETTNFFLYFFF